MTARRMSRGVPVGAVADPGTDVAAHLLPARSFDSACTLVISYLSRLIPMGMWAVMRIKNGRQVVLAVDSPAYGTTAGAEFPYATSFCRPMVTGAAPRIAPDVGAVPAYAGTVAGAPIPVGAYMGTPIVDSSGELFGTLCGYDPAVQSADLRDHEPLLALLSSLLSAVLESDMVATTIARELEQARLEADTDALTGLINRRGWDRYLQQEELRYRRFGDPACVAVLDLDHLKIVNDTEGHDAGDRYIQRTAQVLREVTRSGDLLARLGGDEFGIVMTDAGVEQAAELVERMEKALHEAGIAGCFGHAAYSVVSGFPGAWHAADQAMYQQKRKRRQEA